MEFKVTKLPRNGPKPGQSMRAWMYGKEQETKRFQAALAKQEQEKQR